MDSVESKTCGHCKEEKSIDKFNWKITGKVRQSSCKICQSNFTKQHYSNNKDIYKDRARANVRRAIVFVQDYLSKHPCIDCGEKGIVVLEFDHVSGIKETEISKMVRNGLSNKTISNEISKCEVRCANCHKRRHHKERQKLGL